MINIPKSVCFCSTSTQVTQKLIKINTTDICKENICQKKESVELTPILNTLCLCPVNEVVIIDNRPKFNKTIVTKTCFADFIKNITSTKFCETGPTCKAT